MFFIKSEEEFALCPVCGGLLNYHCRVIRPLLDITSTENRYSIRILKCVNKTCPSTYHRELPDIIVPYKRYDTESIEEAITHGNKEIVVAVDQSTIYRWRKWFDKNAVYIMMALLSVSAGMGNDAESSSLVIEREKANTAIERIKLTVGREIKWLNEAVRILVNSSKWIVNRSAYLSG